MSESPYETAVREISDCAGDLKPSDVILFSEPLRSALNFVIRLRRFALSVFEEKLGFTREQTEHIVNLLVERNLFHQRADDPAAAGEAQYEARLSAPARPISKKPLDIWKKIE